ncbi:MAG: Smr/MutS family protein [Spirochaetaceae bacterium]|nr:Smr/MutS family protein [Spirochaetaceae bacterium]
MKINNKSLKDLGFYQVLENIKKNALSEAGAKRLETREFSTKKETLLVIQNSVDALKTLFENPRVNNPLHFPDLRSVFTSLATTYQSIDGTDLINAASYIDSAKLLCSFLHAPIFYNRSSSLVSNMIGEDIDEELLAFQKEVYYALDDSGKIKESHPAIKRLVEKVEQSKTSRNIFSRSFINNNKASLQSDVETIRDDRIVVAVKADSKANVKGFVHSSSSSGNTIFMEPFQLVELNNSVILAEQQILIEMAKIYSKLSKNLRVVQDKLRELSSSVIKADVLYSLASWISKNNCTKTDLDKDEVNLLLAIHPLLGKKAVPITFGVNNSIKAVVLSGPNAGGKTVTIKTVGLLSLINQFCGFIPCEEGSSLPIFDKIFTDIGDEQSIEDELSTFSAHMNTLSKILNSTSNKSLVILDELGSGTDPQEGGAIACSIVDYLKDRAKLSLITSHQASLKLKAYGEPQLLNASMEFNESSHMPTFRVVTGLPGDSHAIETADRMNLPKEVIIKAKEYLGSDSLQMSEIIKSLEKKRDEARLKLEELEKMEAKLRVEQQKSELFQLKLKQQEFLLKKNQSTDLSRYVQQSRKELEKLVSDLVTGNITKEKTKKVKNFINALGQEEEKLLNTMDNEEETISTNNKESFVIKAGLDVLCGINKREGTVLKQDGKNRWIVQVGSMKISFKEKDLFQSEFKKKVENYKVAVSYHSAAPKPKSQIDVRGCTLEESISIVSSQIEACIVYGFANFSIIHGLGDGILQRGLHEYLKTQKVVQDYRFALPDDGGMGKTYVIL